MNNIDLILQPDGISCGNTCIKMILDFKKIYSDVSISDIVDICGTNMIHGTRDVEMIKGLTYFNIPNKQNFFIDNDEHNIKYLDNILNQNNIFLLRSLTQGIKHWVIVIGKENDYYIVNDPWLGVQRYTIEQLLNIWRPRNYDGFEIFLN